jgi:hypothetical protein
MSQYQTQAPKRKAYSNSGLLRKNTKNPDKSDYTGNLTVTCPQCKADFEFWLNGWKKTFQNGDQFLSLSIKSRDAAPPRPAPQPPAARPQAAQAAAADTGYDDQSDVPF